MLTGPCQPKASSSAVSQVACFGSPVCAGQKGVKSLLSSELLRQYAGLGLAFWGRASSAPAQSKEGGVLRSQVQHLASRSNSALLTDTYPSPLRAQFGAAKRQR